MRSASKPRIGKRSDAYWMRRIQALIQKHCSPVATRGPNKGHSSVDERVWLKELIQEMRVYIAGRATGNYDNNMAMASLLGRALVVWYANVHRAKGTDPRRPLGRKNVLPGVTKYRGQVCAAMADDRLMCLIFNGQEFNMPWGKWARGGHFV